MPKCHLCILEAESVTRYIYYEDIYGGEFNDEIVGQEEKVREINLCGECFHFVNYYLMEAGGEGKSLLQPHIDKRVSWLLNNCFMCFKSHIYETGWTAFDGIRICDSCSLKLVKLFIGYAKHETNINFMRTLRGDFSLSWMRIGRTFIGNNSGT